ncbi:MAG: single-stranded DNA-binding protein [Chloroflexi bacterium]|nr:single-stranded DNA-binding protein [Chloroflexota bacterium]
MSWHQTIIVGNLGGDPELRYLQSGRAVCNFSVAVSERWRDRQSEEQREKTTWYRVAVWGPQAETCNTYLSRGRQVMVIGNVQARGYVNNNGEAAASLDLTARDVRFLGGRDGGGGGQQSGNWGGGQRGGHRGPAQQSDRASNYPDQPASVDDIPF